MHQQHRLSVGGIALTPGYDFIGVAAPVLAVLFRVLQGFALGGEVGPSTALLLESAPVRRRGLYVSLQAMSADGAVMIAGLVGVLLSATLHPAAVDAWGWRLALMLGLAILPFALAARRSVWAGCYISVHELEQQHTQTSRIPSLLR